MTSAHYEVETGEQIHEHLPCPQCSETAELRSVGERVEGWFVSCRSCGYQSKPYNTADETRRAR